MQVCRYASMQIVSMQVYAFMELYKYASVQLCKYAGM